MAITAIIQARLGSTRLPGKVLLPILGKPMLWHQIRRLREVAGIERVVVATSDLPGDGPIREFCCQEGVTCFAGSETDVLDRFYRAAVAFGGDPLIRVTGDCPFVDPGVLASLLELYQTGGFDYVAVAAGAGAARISEGVFPDGLDAECFAFGALERAWREASLGPDREHVTPYIWRRTDEFRCGRLQADGNYGSLRWTVDHPEDFEVVKAVYEGLFQPDRAFRMSDILAYFDSHPELASRNRLHVGHEGYEALWTLEESNTR